MASTIGFQSNTTITSAFWIYKPDPATTQAGKETFIEVNNIQYIEANLEVVLGNIVSTSVSSNIVTIILSGASGLRSFQTVILSGLTNSTFLNGQLLTISVVNPTTITAQFANADYGTTAEPAGALVIDTTHRQVSIYYGETSVSTSQQPRKLEGVVAARFVYDMEALFS